MDTLPVNGHGHGENGLTLAPSAPLTPTTSSSSIRNQLLENIAHQAHLVEALFAEIIHHAGSSSSSSSATSSASSSTLISTYTSLHDASVDQSRLLERARRHQARYERLVRHKESVDRLERAVVGLSRGMSDGDAGGGGGGGLLFELAEIANEAKEVVRRGRKVKDSIDRAQRGEFDFCRKKERARYRRRWRASPAWVAWVGCQKVEKKLETIDGCGVSLAHGASTFSAPGLASNSFQKAAHSVVIRQGNSMLQRSRHGFAIDDKVFGGHYAAV